MKARFMAVIVLCVAALVGTVACSGGGGKAPNGMTGAEILAASQTTTINSMRFSATVETAMMDETLVMYMAGSMDEANREMYMTMTSPDYDYTMQMYITDGWLYMIDPDYSESWIKTRLTDDIWEQENPTAGQMELLEDVLEAKYLAMEIVSGSNCYKIDVDPNWDAILSATDMEETEYYSTDELIDMIKDTECVIWVAEGSYLPMQMFFSMTMEMEIMGQKYSVDVDMTMTFSNINQAVDITLPSAALDATEMTYDEFMAGDW